ncbi:30S ribosomal protein S6 [Myxococcus sp. CA040A]|uniref:30S ribosomal protein S6 n=1 Tax=Myxococcus sp. CA040A TaxID=2741738 RepID=UPI00157A9A9C|nr:30S ribosomal protein S6 [Myxococcus sp. CA040A]NTX01223.1 30S ribosomal protein S6 [Myxococcus sp. CA040A]
MAETQAAKRLREYETIFLVKPDLTDDNVDKLKERVRGIVDREGGKVLRFTVWGKKKTLFPVAKQPRAIYVHASYLGGAKLVAEIERNLKNLDEVTRYISVKLADEVDPETRPVLEDLKLAGDVEETRPGAPAEREGGGFRGDVAEESVGEAEEESSEEA